jgi:hypothetical protein
LSSINGRFLKRLCNRSDGGTLSYPHLGSWPAATG